jgi:hypothetical protein
MVYKEIFKVIQLDPHLQIWSQLPMLCLKKEWKKKASDMSAVDDRMLRTLNSRREIIENGLEMKKNA